MIRAAIFDLDGTLVDSNGRMTCRIQSRRPMFSSPRCACSAIWRPNRRSRWGTRPYDIEAAKKIDLATIALLCGGFPEGELRDAGAIAIFRDPADMLDHYYQSPLAG